VINHRRLSYVNLETNIIFKRIIFVAAAAFVVVDYQNVFESQITNITRNFILKVLLKIKF